MSRRKVREQLQEKLKIECINIEAESEHKNKNKGWSILDLKAIKPLNIPQTSMFESYYNGCNIVADGSAGTGKTYASLFLALSTVLSKSYLQKRILIVRSIVPSREIGFLPGTMEEKMEPYEAPYEDIVCDLMGSKTAYESLKSKNIIEFIPTSFVRGLTWDDAIIILDEIQNYTWQEINSILTRVGTNSKVICIGDYLQCDLNKKNDQSGISKFLSVIKDMKSFDHIIFTKHDIIRSAFVKEWIEAVENVTN